jgi:hypothetical protein
MLRKELRLCSATLHEGLQERCELEVSKHKTKTKDTNISYLASRGGTIQCAQRVGEQLCHTSQRRVQATPLRPLHGVIKGEDRSPRILWVCHSIQGPPHTSRPLLARVKSWDGSPDSGTIRPTCRDASTGTKSPAAEEDDGMDADPCCVTATTGDASVVSSPV